MAESNELRCCAAVPSGYLTLQCTTVATLIKRDGAFDGLAWCAAHPPMKRKGSWVVPVPVVAIEV